MTLGIPPFSNTRARQLGFLVLVAAIGSGVSGARGQSLNGNGTEKGESPRVVSNLRAGSIKIDITPPANTPVTGHPRKTMGVRDPLRAGLLLLDDGKTKLAIATFDLIEAGDALVVGTLWNVHPSYSSRTTGQS